MISPRAKIFFNTDDSLSQVHEAIGSYCVDQTSEAWSAPLHCRESMGLMGQNFRTLASTSHGSGWGRAWCQNRLGKQGTNYSAETFSSPLQFPHAGVFPCNLCIGDPLKSITTRHANTHTMFLFVVT